MRLSLAGTWICRQIQWFFIIFSLKNGQFLGVFPKFTSPSELSWDFWAQKQSCCFRMLRHEPPAWSVFRLWKDRTGGCSGRSWEVRVIIRYPGIFGHSIDSEWFSEFFHHVFGPWAGWGFLTECVWISTWAGWWLRQPRISSTKGCSPNF